MAEFQIDLEELRRLTRLVEDNGLSELRYESGDLRITLRTATFRPSASAVDGLAADDLESQASRIGAAPLAAPAGVRPTTPSVPTATIEAPVMGVFYRSPMPMAPPFVEVGDPVEVGQPVGMIEAMKVFSEVLAEVAGRVREIPAKNGALVQPGEALLILEVEL